MNIENEFGINAEKSAAIAQYFRDVDHDMRGGVKGLETRIAEYGERFGSLNFAALETIFRIHDLGIYLLAIPSHFVESQNPHLMVVNYDDVHQGKVTKMPFAITILPNEAERAGCADGFDLHYTRELNLERLKQAGVYVQRPQFRYKGTPAQRKLN